MASLHEVASRFVAREFVETAGGGNDTRPAHVGRAHWDRIVEMGWTSLLVPEEFGGHGLDLAHLAAVCGAFARQGIATPLVTVAAEVPALMLSAGNPVQQETWLRPMCRDGLIVSSALWELPHPHQLGSVTTTWAEQDGGYEVTGSKLPVVSAADADAFVVLARHHLSDEFALFIIRSDAPGVEIAPLRTTTEDPSAELVLRGTRVEEAARLHDGDVLDAVSGAQGVGAVLTGADLTVYAQRGLELTLGYVRERSQFGQPIGAFQAVHHHCADMYGDVEAMRVLCGPMLRAKLGDELPTRAVSILKAKTSVSARQVLERAHQLHGGVGFYTDYPLERLYRRSLVEQGAFGSSSWHRARLIRLLQDNPANLQRSCNAL